MRSAATCAACSSECSSRCAYTDSRTFGSSPRRAAATCSGTPALSRCVAWGLVAPPAGAAVFGVSGASRRPPLGADRAAELIGEAQVVVDIGAAREIPLELLARAVLTKCGHRLCVEGDRAL